MGTEANPFVCPTCRSANVKLATDPQHLAYVSSVYLRCLNCARVWSITKERYAEWERSRKDNEK